MSIVAVRPQGDAPPSVEISTNSDPVEDALRRAEQAAQAIANLQQQLGIIRRIRAQALAELANARVPLSRIAQVVGLSRQRVTQLIDAVRAGVAT